MSEGQSQEGQKAMPSCAGQEMGYRTSNSAVPGMPPISRVAIPSNILIRSPQDSRLNYPRQIQSSTT